MIEVFAGWIIGASMMPLFLHFTGRLTPRQPETYTGSSNQFSVVSVDTSGRGGNELDPKICKGCRRGFEATAG
jgi:hypothetical protein